MTQSREQLAALVGDLGRSVGDADELLEYLHRAARLTMLVVAGADHAGITVTLGERTFTAVSTDEVMRRVDENQYAAGDGPCLQAARTGEMVRVDVGASHGRWPRFAADAEGAGVRSFLAAPLGSEQERFGALNLYSRSADGFGDQDEELLKVTAEQLVGVIQDYQRLSAALDMVGQLQEAMRWRAPIEQAKGILMATHQVDADEAFAILRSKSQHSNTKLHTVAAAFVASAAGPIPEAVQPEGPAPVS